MCLMAVFRDCKQEKNIHIPTMSQNHLSHHGSTHCPAEHVNDLFIDAAIIEPISTSGWHLEV